MMCRPLPIQYLVLNRAMISRSTNVVLLPPPSMHPQVPGLALIRVVRIFDYIK